MKRILTCIAPFVVALGLIALVLQTDASVERPAAVSGHQSLIEMLPDSTVAAVEVRDLARRWEEIRSVTPITTLQALLLASGGFAAGDVPLLAGNRAVVALVKGEDGRSVMPLALLRPARPAEAMALLDAHRGAGCGGGPPYAVYRQQDILWIGPAGSSERLARLARAGGSDVARRMAMDEVDRRLPSGGLGRGWLDPAAARELLRNQVEGTRPPMLEMLDSLLAAELEAVRFAGFRRDVTADGVVTDAIVGYDTEILPAEMTHALRSTPTPSILPTPMPDRVVAALAFRPESEAAMAWLRQASAGDPRGPLRNLDFWIEELEARTGIELERDLIELVGERGWLFILEGEASGTVQLVAILETPNSDALTNTLVHLRSWWIEHAWGRSLGFVRPIAHDETYDRGTVYALTLWTPLGELPGPAFTTADGHLIVGSGRAALMRGVSLLSGKPAWEPAVREADLGRPPNESMLLRGPALSSLLNALIGACDSGSEASPAAMLVELAASLDDASLGIWYEEDAVRLRGRLTFNKPEKLGSEPR